MVGLKADADQIKNFLSNLAQQDWIKRTERRWWPKFVFHYTDIRNAVRILQEGHLYSRTYLEGTKNLVVSSGSPVILAGTNTVIKDCVRLYFRPKTPTQYHAEGIRSQPTLAASKFPHAHCPVPVFFLFDAANILTRDDCCFSDRGLGSRKYQIFSSATELEQLPWKKIYHTGWIDPSKTEESDIVSRRNAEVIIPGSLNLSALCYVYCRSNAERETLLHLLSERSPSLRTRYQDKIVATTRSTLFYRQQTFIESVRLLSEAAYVHFSPETKSKGPFCLQLEHEAPSFQKRQKKEHFSLQEACRWKFSLVKATGYTIRLFLDRHLAYANRYEEIEIPF